MGQPLKIYTEYALEKIPQFIEWGTTPDGATVRLHKDQIANKHVKFEGKTGQGKSRSIAIFLQQILSFGIGRVIFLDPLGEVYSLMMNWISYLAREYFMKGESSFQWFKEKILDQVFFWDLSQKDHQFRHSIIEPMPGEDLHDVIARNIKFFDSLYSNESGDSGMELQLQRRLNLVSLITIFSATQTSFGQARYFIHDENFREQQLRQAEQRSTLPEVREAVDYFRFLIGEFKGGKWAEKMISLVTGIAPFYESRILRNFMLTSENNVDFQDILNSKSLIIKAPANDLPTKRILFKYLYTMFFDLAPKRPKKRDWVYLGSDESSLVMDHTYADMITRIRNYRIALITSYQTNKQMLTREGENIAKTISSQSQIQTIFACDYDDALDKADENITYTGKHPKHIEFTITTTKSAGESASESISEGVTRQKGVGIGRNFQEGITETSARSYSVTNTSGITQSIQKQWSEAESASDTMSFNINGAFTFSESLSRGLSQLRGDNISFTLGQGKSCLRIDTDSGTVSVSESEGVTETTSESNGYSEGEGSSDSYSLSSGDGTSMNFSRNHGGQSYTIIDGAPVPIGSAPTGAVSQTINNFNSTSNSHSQQKNKAWNTLKGIANSLSKTKTHGRGYGKTTGNTFGTTSQQNIALSQQFSESVNLSKQYATAIQKSLGQSKAYGHTFGTTRSVGESLSRNIQKAIQQGESLSLAITKSYGVNLNETMSKALSQGKAYSFATNVGLALSISWKLTYYSIAEERVLHAQKIRSQPPRSCFLRTGDGGFIQLATTCCYDLHYEYKDLDFRKILSEYYKNLPTSKEFKLLLPDSFPAKPVEEVKIFRNLPFDEGFFPPLE